MKTLITYITEKQVPELTKFVEKEPDNKDKNHFVEARFYNKWLEETAKPIYVDFNDISDASQTGVFTAFYNLGKKRSSDTTQVGISTWDEHWDENGGAWEQFATAGRTSKTKMWHPEWIKIKNHPFK